MILIKNAEVYAPSYLGKKDILIGGERILKIRDSIDIPGHLPDEIIDANGMMLIPGLIDGHVHIAGAGGEGGPSTRTPEMKLEKMIEGGITTVIGCLGTDGFTRSPQNVLMKVKSLRELGVSAWMWTGAYQV
ncbi:MAG: amidohydrolase family protein, partial [Bacteroidales bacterium]|nr:amidohydrolase family protein [Bacteroidales bacterium]